MTRIGNRNYTMARKSVITFGICWILLSVLIFAYTDLENYLGGSPSVFASIYFGSIFTVVGLVKSFKKSQLVGFIASVIIFSAVVAALLYGIYHYLSLLLYLLK